MSEKYWVFQNNQVVGPFEIEDLLHRAGFSGETLVCSEGRQGTDAGDWQRADLVPRIAEALSRPKSPQSPLLTAKQASSSSEVVADAIIIKEMTLLGAVHEKIGALGQSVLQIQETVNGNDKEIAALRMRVEEKTRQVEELTGQVKVLDGIAGSLEAFKEKLQALSEFQSRQASLEELARSQHRNIEELNQKIDFLSHSKESDSAFEGKLAELNNRLDSLATKINGDSQLSGTELTLSSVKETVDELKREVEEIKSHQAPIQDSFVSPLGHFEAPVTPETAHLNSSPDSFPLQGGASSGVDLQAPSASAPFSPSEPVPDASQAVESPATFQPGEPSFPLSPESFTNPPQENATSNAPDFILPTQGFQDGAQIETKQEAFSKSGNQEPAVSLSSEFVVESPSPKTKPKKKKGVLPLVFIIIMGAMFALAYVLGLIPGLKTTKPEIKAQPVLPPPSSPFPGSAQPQQAAVGSLPQDQEEAFKNSAIHLVQNWPVGATGKNVAQVLGVSSIASGNLNSWMAEKIKDNLYQVNFYATVSSGAPGKTYEFQADLSLQKVVGQNQAAVSLLSGEPIASAQKVLSKRKMVHHKPTRLKKKKIVKKNKVVKKIQKAPAKPAAVSAEVMPGMTAPSQPASPAPKPAAQPSEDQALDQLLKP